MASIPPGRVRLATASPATEPTVAETVQKLADVALRAAQEKADILLLPEAFIGGYPRGTTFGSSIGGRSQEGRDEYLQYFSQAVDLGDTINDGAGEGDGWVRGGHKEGEQQTKDAFQDDGRVDGDGTRQKLEKIASDTGVFLVTGLIERVGGSLYCAVVYICPRLGMIGKRRKVMPTGSERLVWAQGSPATLKAVTTVIRGVRINLAAAICWENYMPLLRQSLYAQNVNLYLAPTADGRDTWLPLMRTIGIEGRCFVVSSNMCVQKGSYGDSRRKSVHRIVRDEYGNEIVIPLSPGGHRKRPSIGGDAKIVKDGYGNEIVIPSGGTDGGDTGGDPTPTASSKSDVAVGKEFVSRGGSCIVSPFGDALAGPQWEDPDGIIYADVDFQDCIKGRLDLDVAGSYSRNDAFKLSVEGLEMKPLSYYY